MRSHRTLRDLRGLIALFNGSESSSSSVSSKEKTRRQSISKIRTSKRRFEQGAKWLGRDGVVVPTGDSGIRGVGRSSTLGSSVDDEIAGDPTRDGQPLEFHEVDGPAFVDGASFYDVDQGQLGDCWLMGACAAVAHKNNHYLHDMIKKRPDGNYDVRFFVKQSDGSFTKHIEPNIAPTFPNFSADASPNETEEIWVALIEKAYAQWQGNDYGELNGGKASAAMEAITGYPSIRESIDDHTPSDDLHAILDHHVNAGHPVAVATRDKGEEIHPKLANWHYYAVLGTTMKNGVPHVRLYNPWGPNDSGKNKPFLLPTSDLRDSVKVVDINLC